MGKKIDGDAQKKTPVVSREYSCSELKNGQKALMEVKLEGATEAELEKQIKELNGFFISPSIVPNSWSVRHVEKIHSLNPNKDWLFNGLFFSA